MGKVQNASNCFEHMILGMGKVEAPRYLGLPSWKQRQDHWRKWSYNQTVIRSIGQVSHHVSPDFLGVREPGKWGKLAHWIHLSYGHLREFYEFLHFSRLVLKTTVHLSKPAGCFRRISAFFFSGNGAWNCSLSSSGEDLWELWQGTGAAAGCTGGGFERRMELLPFSGETFGRTWVRYCASLYNVY